MLYTQPDPDVSFGMMLWFVFVGIQQAHLATSTPFLTTGVSSHLASVQYTQGAKQLTPPPVKASPEHVPFSESMKGPGPGGLALS